MGVFPYANSDQIGDRSVSRYRDYETLLLIEMKLPIREKVIDNTD